MMVIVLLVLLVMVLLLAVKLQHMRSVMLIYIIELLICHFGIVAPELGSCILKPNLTKVDRWVDWKDVSGCFDQFLTMIHISSVSRTMGLTCRTRFVSPVV